MKNKQNGAQPERSAEPWIPSDERLFSFWNSIGLAFGIILFLVGTMIQYSVPRYPEANQLMESCMAAGATALETCRTAVMKFDAEAHRASGMNFWLAASELMRGLGSAVFLSIIISVTIERRNRSRFMDALTGKTKELSLSVFTGMFNRNHPSALLDAVKDQILERELIRDTLGVTYTLSLWEAPAEFARIAGQKFIRVDVLLSSTIRNVSTLKNATAGRVEIPLGLGLPNPMLDELKPMVCVSNFVVGGVPLPAETIASANATLQENLASDSEEDASVDFGTHTLQPGESINVSANYTMMKELEDTEVFRTRQIARSLSLTVVDNTQMGLKVRAKGIHSRKIEKMASGAATTQWRLSDIILPQQGIMVWWKVPLTSPPNAAHGADNAL